MGKHNRQSTTKEIPLDTLDIFLKKRPPGKTWWQVSSEQRALKLMLSFKWRAAQKNDQAEQMGMVR